MKTGLFCSSQKTFHSWFRLGGPGSGAGLDLGMRGREDAHTWPHTRGPCRRRGAGLPLTWQRRTRGDGRGSRPHQLPPPPLPPSPELRAPWQAGPAVDIPTWATRGQSADPGRLWFSSGEGSGIRAHSENTEHPSEQMAGCLLASVSGAVYILK